MITTKTLLILGAGASAPYGFPTGDSYKDAVLDVLKSPNEEPRWSGLQVSRDERMEVFEAFRQSNQKSIDLFLQRRYSSDTNEERKERFLRIGKLAIARVIMGNEDSAKLYFQRNRTDHWYEYLWQFIDTDPKNFGDNRISIITFNYDRSLEYFLYYSLKNSYAIDSDVEIYKYLKALEIHHVYGELGRPHFVDLKEGLAYGSEVSPSTMKKAAQNIKIVGERNDAVTEMRNLLIYDWIKTAERIAFLGFGFDTLNLAVLNLKETVKSRAIFATAKGLESAEIGRIQLMLWGLNGPEFGEKNDDVLACLRKLPIFLPES